MPDFGKYVSRLPASTPPELARALADVFRDIVEDIGVEVADEGTVLGTVDQINFVGAPVSVSVLDGKATATFASSDTVASFRKRFFALMPSTSSAGGIVAIGIDNPFTAAVSGQPATRSATSWLTSVCRTILRGVSTIATVGWALTTPSPVQGRPSYTPNGYSQFKFVIAGGTGSVVDTDTTRTHFFMGLFFRPGVSAASNADLLASNSTYIGIGRVANTNTFALLTKKSGVTSPTVIALNNAIPWGADVLWELEIVSTGASGLNVRCWSIDPSTGAKTLQYDGTVPDASCCDAYAQLAPNLSVASTTSQTNEVVLFGCECEYT